MSNLLSVTKSNALIESGYRLSLTEMQIVLYGISLVNPMQKNFPRYYKIDMARFAHMFNRSHGQIYTEIKEAVVKRFWERDFSYVDDKGKIVTVRWLSQITHEDKTGYLEIKFSEEIQPYLHKLQGNFTSFYIDKIAKFKSIYSIRFYEYAVMCLNKDLAVDDKEKGKFSLLISEIKTWLGLEDKYNRFTNFKTRVLEVSKKEINEFSDLNFNYKILKLGRYPHQIEFSVSRKKQDTHLENIPDKQKIKISTIALERAKKIVIDTGTRWDLYVIEQQFYEYIKKAGHPKNLDAAFIGFVKKKVAKNPN